MDKPAPAADCTATAAARLAREHDAHTLAAALVERLRADGCTDLARAIVAVLDAHGAPTGDAILTSPPNPHKASQG